MADSEKVSSLPSERERFEAWAKEVGFADAKLWTLKGVYLNDEAQAGWRAWQAASAGRQEQALRDRLEAMLFHPSASHVPPDYRDGYNHAIRSVIDLLDVD